MAILYCSNSCWSPPGVAGKSHDHTAPPLYEIQLIYKLMFYFLDWNSQIGYPIRLFGKIQCKQMVGFDHIGRNYIRKSSEITTNALLVCYNMFVVLGLLIQYV